EDPALQGEEGAQRSHSAHHSHADRGERPGGPGGARGASAQAQGLPPDRQSIRRVCRSLKSSVSVKCLHVILIYSINSVTSSTLGPRSRRRILRLAFPRTLMKVHANKRAIRALGVAESFRGTDRRSILAGVVMRSDLVIDGFAFGEATVEGDDATESILRLYRRLRR